MRFAAIGLGLGLGLGLGACVDNIDPVWQLNHDRIVAVRATPPHVPAGGVATLDGLVAHRGAPPDVEVPMFATAMDPATGLSPVVMQSGGAWQVTAPDDAQLAQARAKLGLAAGAPVPFSVTVAFPDSNGEHLVATKLVYFGDAQDNPALGAVTVDGAAPAGGDLGVPPDTDVPLAIDTDPMNKVSWLSSCGTLHDDTEHDATLHVQPKDPQHGELAVVVREPDGGVVWQVWTIHAP